MTCQQLCAALSQRATQGFLEGPAYFHWAQRGLLGVASSSSQQQIDWCPTNDRVASQVALVVKNPPPNAGDPHLVPGLGKSPGGGHGNPLQYSCLENPMDRGAWWATVHGVTQSWKRLKQLSSSSSSQEENKNACSSLSRVRAHCGHYQLILMPLSKQRAVWRVLERVYMCRSREYSGSF